MTQASTDAPAQGDIYGLMNGVLTALHIARHGSYRAAARSTGLSFRRLEGHLSSLEEHLGFPVFHRTADGMVLTREGHFIFEQAQKLDEILLKVRRLASSVGNDVEGEVVLSTTEGLGTFWISPQLSELAKSHPNITVRMQQSMSVTNMRRFESDLAIQVVEPVQPEIKRVKLGKLHFVLAASSSYFEKHGKPKTLGDLAKHKFVIHSNSQWSDQAIIETAVGATLKQSQMFMMRNSVAHYQSLFYGHGIGFIPSYGFAIGTNLEFVNLPVRHELDIWLCFHEEARNTPRISHVIDWLTSSFDPRLYPWFRRDFVPPTQYREIVEKSGIADLLNRLDLKRAS